MDYPTFVPCSGWTLNADWLLSTCAQNHHQLIARPTFGMLTLLTTARDKTEAALLVARLRDAGIPCMRGGGEGPRGISRSAREIYVDEASLPRAREILEEDRGDFDEEELARLSEEAGQRWAPEDSPAAQGTAHTTDVAGDVVQAATPTKGHSLRHAIERLAGHETDKPRGPFGR